MIRGEPGRGDLAWLYGEIGAQLARRDWSEAGVGPPETWPDPMRSALALILRSGFPMFLIWGPDQLLLYNQAYVPILGHKHPAALGSRFWTVWPEVRDQLEPVLEAAFAGQSSFFEDLEMTLIRGAGPETTWFTFSYSPVTDARGVTQGVLCAGVETTATVRERTAREAREARLGFLDLLATETAKFSDADEILKTTARMIGEHLGLSVCAYADMDEDQDGFTIRGDWSAPGSPTIVGHYSLAGFGKLAVRNLGAGLPLVVNDNRVELAPEEAATFQNIGITATICMPLVKDGRLTALMAIHQKQARVWTEDDLALIREVTDRSWAHVERVGSEAALRASEARFRAAVQAVEGVVWTNDAEGRMTGEQPGWSMLTGQTPAAYEGFGWAAAVHPDDAAPTLVAWQEAVAERKPFVFEHRLRRHDGEWRQFSIRAAPILADDGMIVEWVGVHTDVTLQRQAEAALRHLNATLERRVADALQERKILADLVEGTDAFVQVIDLDFRWLAINRAAADEFEEIFGVRPRVGQSMLEVLADQPEHMEAVRAIWSRALGGEEFTEIAEFGDSQRARRHYEMKYNVLRDGAGRQIAAYHFVYDVSTRMMEQRRLAEAEDQLRHAQKMEAMGQLTGGVAHDFNNLLTPIVGALDILQRRAFGGEREQRLIGAALQSADRAKTLVQRLLAFARRQPLQPTSVDVGALVAGMADLIASTTGPQIKVVVDIQDDLPPARTDQNQLEMALLNLAVNARDAMPESGTLRITAAHSVVGPNNAFQLKPGRYVRISVADSGEGMDEATLARAVEPFFSTKGVGKGTGLGLSMVHGLVQQLGGGLTINSRRGFGTNVELWLPESDDAPGRIAQDAETLVTPVLLGTALLVDDEDLVRLSTADMLTDLGFSVVEASSAEQALALVRDGLRPRVVVTDHLMPGMSGVQLARAVEALLPGTPVLVVSGYAEQEVIDPDLPLLSKPFRNSDLAQSITAIL